MKKKTYSLNLTLKMKIKSTKSTIKFRMNTKNTKIILSIIS